MEEAKIKAKNTYDSASDTFDDPANSYWEKYGRRTVELLELPLGACVLDVACGTGASAIPAAEIVGPLGKVVGVDLSAKMLELARAKAASLGLKHIEFREGDMTQLDFPDNNFNAVVCVFSIFFVPDMPVLVSELWRMVKPGGKLAITTWGPDLFEPMYSIYDNVIKETRPNLVSEFRPWDRITTESALEQLIKDGGAENIIIESEAGEQKLQNSDSWWKIVMGSGLRSAVNAMGPEMAEEVRIHNKEYIEKNDIHSVTTNVIYGVAQKSV